MYGVFDEALRAAAHGGVAVAETRHAALRVLQLQVEEARFTSAKQNSNF